MKSTSDDLSHPALSRTALTLSYLAAGYTAAGLLSGVLYRELTRSLDFVGHTQLSVLHTHLLTLGTILTLLFLAIEVTLKISHHRLFRAFFWSYQLGVLLTALMMGIRGIQQLNGTPASSALAGISGLGHILITVAFGLFFTTLIQTMRATFHPAAPTPAHSK